MGFKKGNIPWNTGKKGLFHHTEEFKQKQRERMIGRTYGGFKKGNIPWNKGKTGVYSEEFYEQKREQMRGKKYWLGRKHTEETKKKISLGNKGKIMSEEARRKLSEYRGEKASFWGRKHSEETKQKMRLARLNRKPFPIKDTSIERKLHEGLDSRNIQYQKQVNVCDICQPDIVFSQKKVAVFADGDYWHSREFDNGETWRRDRNQDTVLRENGWVPLRFLGSKINKNPVECVNEIMSVLEVS